MQFWNRALLSSSARPLPVREKEKGIITHRCYTFVLWGGNVFPFLLKGIVLAMMSVGVGRGMLKQILDQNQLWEGRRSTCGCVVLKWQWRCMLGCRDWLLKMCPNALWLRFIYNETWVVLDLQEVSSRMCGFILFSSLSWPPMRIVVVFHFWNFFWQFVRMSGQLVISDYEFWKRGNTYLIPKFYLNDSGMSWSAQDSLSAVVFVGILSFWRYLGLIIVDPSSYLFRRLSFLRWPCGGPSVGHFCFSCVDFILGWNFCSGYIWRQQVWETN